MDEQNTSSISWARRRQVIIVVILMIFVFFVALGADTWFFSKQPTCFDGRQNGGETGIDCGGKCALVCLGLAKDPLVEYTRLFKGLRGYSAVAHIENQNDLVVKNASYSFKLYDANGALIGERDGTTFIPQRKDFPIFEPNIDTKGVEPAKVFFAFDANLAWEKSDYVEPKLDVEDEKLSGEKTSPRLVANITNPTVRDVDNVQVTSVLYDDGGNAIDSSKTVIDSIKPNQTVPIVYTFPYPLPESVHVCAQPVDVALIIDRSGSMEFLGTNPPQPLTDVKNAADYFVKQLNDKNQASVISFANSASDPIDTVLTPDLDKVVSVIDGIFIYDRTKEEQNTNIASGLQSALGELTSPRHDPNSARAVVLLTDGVANLPVKAGDPNYPENTATAIANTIKGDGISLFTIGLGKDLNKDFLTSIASVPEDSFFAPTTAELTSIYQTIGIKICKTGTSRIEISPLVPPQD